MTAKATAGVSAGNNQGVQVGANNGTIRDIIINNIAANDNCLKDLRLTDTRYDKERIKDTKGGLLESAYKWILDHPDFRQWRDNNQSRLLWIKGDPGKGKTMLLIGIVEELERLPAQTMPGILSTSQATALSYFFLQGTDSNLNNATAVLRGLIFLLAVQNPSLSSHLREKYEQSGAKLFNDGNAFFALSDILSGMLRDPSLARAYLVIDALDECETDLERLLKLIVQNASLSRVKWIVSSRNKHDIEQKLKLDGSQTKLSLELRANAEHVSRAVGVYIDDRVSRVESLRDDDELRHKAAHILRQKADGTFLWVALVIQELQKVATWNVLDVLEEMLTGLEELRAIRTAGESFTQCPKIAGIKLCASFLTVRDDQVYVVHQSAKDYLSGRGALVSPSDHPQASGKNFLTSLEAAGIVFPSGREQTHRDVSLLSIQAISVTLKRDIYDLGDPGFWMRHLKVPVHDPLACLRYSCIHWVDHICEAKQRDVLADGGPVHKFLEGYLLYWIEALSLSGAISDAVFAVAKLERLLKTESRESSLLSSTQDAHRFLLYNGLRIKNAPLQIYVSALLFSPTCSVTRRLFENEAPQWILAGPPADKRWGPLVHTLEGHNHRVESVAFSPDCKLIASASHDGTVKVWDATTTDVQRTLDGNHGGIPCCRSWVESVAFSPDGKLIASASCDKTIKIWDVTTGAVQRMLDGHRDWVKSVAFSPDGKLIASASYDKIIKVWHATTGELQRTLSAHGDRVESVAFSADGKLIASASHDGTVKVWDASTNVAQRTLKGHIHRVGSAAFSPDGKLIVSASYDDTVKIWDATTGEVQRTLNGHGDWVKSAAFSPDGKLIVSASCDKTIKVWDAATGQLQRTLLGHGDRVESVAFSADGKLIASASYDGTVKVWDATTDEVQHTLNGRGETIKSVAFSPDGKLIASASFDSTIKVRDATTGEVYRTLNNHGYRIESVAFSPDGKLIASASFDGTIKVRDATTGEVHRTLNNHGDRVELVAFWPDGELTTSVSCNKTFEVWDAATGQYQRTVLGHGDRVEAFSADGKLIASASYEGPIPSRSQPQPHRTRRHRYGISQDQSWVTWNGHRVLWLPPECRPSCSTSTAWCSAAPSLMVRVAIGCRSGKVIVISFSGPPPGLPQS